MDNVKRVSKQTLETLSGPHILALNLCLFSATVSVFVCFLLYYPCDRSSVAVQNPPKNVVWNDQCLANYEALSLKLNTTLLELVNCMEEKSSSLEALRISNDLVMTLNKEVFLVSQKVSDLSVRLRLKESEVEQLADQLFYKSRIPSIHRPSIITEEHSQATQPSKSNVILIGTFALGRLSARYFCNYD